MKCGSRRFRFEPDSPMAGPRNFLRDGQAEPRSLDRRLKFTASIEFIKNSCLFARQYFAALVADADRYTRPRPLGRDTNLRAWPRILPGVVHHLNQHLLEKEGIAHNRRQILRYLHHHL